MTRFFQRAALLLLLCAGSAQAQVTISQVYGGGGNSGATLKSDFIELRNNGASAVNVSGWSVQYASSTGTSWTRTNLTGSIAPGGYYLIKQADGTGGSVALPTPDATGTVAMSGTAGKVALVMHQTALTGACPLGGAVVDFVGYGSANCAETSPTAGLTNTTAAVRKGDGATDTGNNANDFSVGAPNPRNGATTPPPPPIPAIALTIAQIQGSALVSAYAGQRVVTEGIVTARKFNNGFFLQMEAGDGNAATSDGIFVFTAAAPAVAVGNRVRVTAKVGEFTPASNPNQLSITQLTEPVVEVLDAVAALPAPVELSAADFSAAATPGTAEKYEGMRVSAASSVVVGASDGPITESTASSGTDGVFYVTLPQVATPFREPGIGVLDAITIPAGKTPPRFDTNPERLMVRSRGQIGATALSVDNDATVSGLVGVMDYFSGTWAVLPDVTSPPVVSGGRAPTAVADARYEDVTIGGFNLLRFFDEVNDRNGAPTLTAAALDKRLTKTSGAICSWLKAPDILGVVEVENQRVLQLLAERINSTCPAAPAYTAYLIQGNDLGGINVGFLVSGRRIKGQARVDVVDVTQYGKDAPFANPDGSNALLNDRPPLALRAVVRQDNGASYPVTVIVNHLRSLNGIDEFVPGGAGWPTESARVRAKRGAQAVFLAGVVEQLQRDDASGKVVLVGDFNAFEFNDGYVDVLGIVKGTEAPAEQVLTWFDSPLSVPLHDGSAFIADARERYSYVFEGNAQSLDHALVNQALVDDALDVRVEHARINADFGVHRFGETGHVLHVSDHDPVRIAIGVPAFRSADMGVITVAAADSVRVGNAIVFGAQVSNAGPNAADFASIAFAFDALVSPQVSAPAGWVCDAPVQTATDTSVTCTTASLARGASADFSVAVIPGDALGGRSLTLATAVTSSITDPATGNNRSLSTVAVLAQADLAIALSGPTQPFRAGTIAAFPVTVTNAGPDAAWQPRVQIGGDAPAANVSLDAPQGWQCTVDDAAGGFLATCTHAGAFTVGAVQVFDLRITAPVREGRDAFIVDAQVSASTPDTVEQNNAASFATRIVGAHHDTPAPTRPAPTPPGRTR